MSKSSNTGWSLRAAEQPVIESHRGAWTIHLDVTPEVAAALVAEEERRLAALEKQLADAVAEHPEPELGRAAKRHLAEVREAIGLAEKELRDAQQEVNGYAAGVNGSAQHVGELATKKAVARLKVEELQGLIPALECRVRDCLVAWQAVAKSTADTLRVGVWRSIEKARQSCVLSGDIIATLRERFILERCQAAVRNLGDRLIAAIADEMALPAGTILPMPLPGPGELVSRVESGSKVTRLERGLPAATGFQTPQAIPSGSIAWIGPPVEAHSRPTTGATATVITPERQRAMQAASDAAAAASVPRPPAPPAPVTEGGA